MPKPHRHRKNTYIQMVNDVMLDDDGPRASVNPPADFFPLRANFVSFISFIAITNGDKQCVSFIHSGATHSFLNNANLFKPLDEMHPQIVKVADETSQAIDKGTVFIKLGVKSEAEAYNAQTFNANIIGLHVLSNFVEVFKILLL